MLMLYAVNLVSILLLKLFPQNMSRMVKDRSGYIILIVKEMSQASLIVYTMDGAITAAIIILTLALNVLQQVHDF